MFLLPGWSLEVSDLWHNFPAPCETDIVLKVLENSFYMHTIRIVNDVNSINYNGNVSRKQ